MDGTLTRSMLRTLKRMLRAGFDLLIPPTCMGCGQRGSTWCDACQGRREKPRGARCTVCGLPRVFRECPSCSQEISCFRVESLAAYQLPLSRALVTFKYQPNLRFAEILAGWCATKQSELGWEPDLVVPVPLSDLRFRQRGYNQVELITSSLARLASIPHGNSIIHRVRDTRSQVGLDARSRYQNMKQAFMAKTPQPGAKRVLLVDDLLTTGATLVACAEALFSADTEYVYALTIARA